jgi:FkbM family methyltransferase
MGDWGTSFLDNDWSLRPLPAASPSPDFANIASLQSQHAPIFLIGRNVESEVLANHLPIEGIIDDFDHSRWQSKRAFRFTEVPNDAVVINAVSSIYPKTVESMILRKLSNASILSYRDVYLANSDDIPQPTYGISVLDVSSNLETLIWCQRQVVSVHDLEVFRSILNFRMTGLPEFLERTVLPAGEHYLHRMLLGPAETLVDFGGFNGDSALKLHRFLGGPRNVIIYEPDHAHNGEIQENFKEVKCNLEIRNLAVSDREARGELKDSGLSRAHFEEAREGEVAQVALGSEIFPEGPTVWKFDIEGAELRALSSASTLLERGDVRLAISIYHDPTHLFLIPAIIRQMFPGAQIGFGHYTEGWSESVMYVVPG